MSHFELQGTVGPVVKINGQSCSYFGGTSYYCLHSRQELIQAAVAATTSGGISSATGRISTGVTTLLRRVESTAAQFFGVDEAVYLASGFLTGMAALQGLQDSIDLIVADEATHFSNIAAAKSTGKRLLFFPHLDADGLAKLLTDHLRADESPLIVTDGVFPAFGEIAPIKDYLAIAETFDGKIWIDDAHAIGVLGHQGRGTCDHYDIDSRRIFFGASLAKAVGGFGGIVPGDRAFIDALRCGPVAVTASSPPIPAAAATIAGLNILTDNPDMRNRLWRNASYLKKALRGIGISANNTNVPIVAWQLDEVDAMIALRDALFRNGIFIQFVQGYGLSRTPGILRICVFSDHTVEQLDHLAAEIGRLS